MVDLVDLSTGNLSTELSLEKPDLFAQERRKFQNEVPHYVTTFKIDIGCRQNLTQLPVNTYITINTSQMTTKISLVGNFSAVP